MLPSSASHFATVLEHERKRIEASGLAQLTLTVRALRRVEALLRAPLRIGIMGEFNSGKSSLANLLIGYPALPTFQLSNTRIATRIHYAEAPCVTALFADGRHIALGPSRMPDEEPWRVDVGLPAPQLRGCEVVDLPGLADPWLGYCANQIGRHRIDLGIWCTFSTQAWKESEAAAWLQLPLRVRENGILAVTNRDLLAPGQEEKIMAHLARVAGPHFRACRAIAAPLARQALDSAGAVADAEVWERSGADDFLEAVEQAISRIVEARTEKARQLVHNLSGRALHDLPES
jgi:hypothetical protein